MSIYVYCNIAILPISVIQIIIGLYEMPIELEIQNR